MNEISGNGDKVEFHLKPFLVIPLHTYTQPLVTSVSFKIWFNSDALKMLRWFWFIANRSKKRFSPFHCYNPHIIISSEFQPLWMKRLAYLVWQHSFDCRYFWLAHFYGIFLFIIPTVRVMLFNPIPFALTFNLRVISRSCSEKCWLNKI